MRLFIFLILVLTVLASHHPRGEERLANIINRLQSVFEETVSDERLAPALEENLSGGIIAGGIEVIETVQNIFENLPVMTFLKTQTAAVNKLVEDMQKDADAYKKVIGNTYVEFQDRLLIHIRMIEKVGSKLIELATTSWLSCGVNAAKILHSSYTKETQEQFSEFLDKAISMAESITTDLENTKIEVHQLQEEAITNQIVIKQHFEGEISSLEADKKKKELGYIACIFPPLCAGAVIIVGELKKKIEKSKRYLRNLSSDLIDDFENAEDHATNVVDVMKRWIPQSEALRIALEHTESVQGGLLPTLQARYLEDHPDQAGIQNAYLIRLFIAMQGLQIASERLDGFVIPDVKCTGVSRVPDYPTQHQVCACETIKVDDWTKSKQCMDGASTAMQDVENFPFCKLTDASCKNDIKNFLPNVCKNGLGWPKDNACVDTPNFNNGRGMGCANYVQYGWCRNGAAGAGQEWTLGNRFRFPEDNCCECGKRDGTSSDQSSAPCTPLFKPGASSYALRLSSTTRDCDTYGEQIVTVAISNTLRCKDGSIAESQLSPSVDKKLFYLKSKNPTRCYTRPIFETPVYSEKSSGHRWYIREGDSWYFHSVGNSPRGDDRTYKWKTKEDEGFTLKTRTLATSETYGKLKHTCPN